MDAKNTASFYTVLYKYRGIFPGLMPTRVPPSWELRDIHEIPLVEGAEPVRKSMYRQSP